jgi:hypothetical protein
MKKDTDLLSSEPLSSNKGPKDLSNPTSYLNNYDEERNKKRPILITDNEKSAKYNKQSKIA